MLLDEAHYDAGDAARGIAMAALFGGGFGVLGQSGEKLASKYRQIVQEGTAKVDAFDGAVILHGIRTPALG
ncbi:hypothetical protein GJ654_20545 [Rhodoblastus acidophilus]|uniref:Uncharacterized protein n=1 Tax=Rhodoblastus acidophilus TaxID=1074 RepID=A0A6N8DSU7_RHOAC|nr:hypothetical protein [Rhodoblastus acidophilus]MCW2276568.1 hypothetical protein [Rhodoblastus acidophilus]MTV33368.1 hypothetical protein [Rhodoblastus acidophilus]